MTKRRGGGLPNNPNPGGMGGMNPMAMLKKMQDDMQKAQEELATETVEVSVGGGALTIVITGHQRIQSISINQALLDTSDPEWTTDLQDLLLAAVNQAIEQSQTMAAEKMESITGGLGNIPGLGGLLG
jgi:hypothetical protein